jgi:hypothetical protein
MTTTIRPDGKPHDEEHGNTDPSTLPQKDNDEGFDEPAPGHLDNPKTIEPAPTSDPAA